MVILTPPSARAEGGIRSPPAGRMTPQLNVHHSVQLQPQVSVRQILPEVGVVAPQVDGEQLKAAFVKVLEDRDKEWQHKILAEREQVASVVENISSAVQVERGNWAAAEAEVQQRLQFIASRCSTHVNDMQEKVTQLAAQAQQAVAERDMLLDVQQSQIDALMQQPPPPLPLPQPQPDYQMPPPSVPHTHPPVAAEPTHDALQAQLQHYQEQQLQQLNDLQQQVFLKQREIEALEAASTVSGHPNTNSTSVPHVVLNGSPPHSFRSTSSLVKHGFDHLQRHQSNLKRMASASSYRSTSATSLPCMMSSRYGPGQKALTPEMELHVSRHL